MEFFCNGFVVYSELLYDESGMPYDKNIQNGFSWILENEEFDPVVLFPKKNKIRTLMDYNILRKYINECKNREIQINIYMIYSPISYITLSKKDEYDALKMCSFLGYDYVSLDLDYSAVYEACFMDIYNDFEENFLEKTKKSLNEFGYFNNYPDLKRFIIHREEVINDFCEDIALENVDLVLRFNYGNMSNDDFFPIQVWKVDLEKLQEKLDNIQIN